MNDLIISDFSHPEKKEAQIWSSVVDFRTGIITPKQELKTYGQRVNLNDSMSLFSYQ